jgi:hypothetical protein
LLEVPAYSKQTPVMMHEEMLNGMSGKENNEGRKTNKEGSDKKTKQDSNEIVKILGVDRNKNDKPYSPIGTLEISNTLLPVSKKRPGLSLKYVDIQLQAPSVIHL